MYHGSGKAHDVSEVLVGNLSPPDDLEPKKVDVEGERTSEIRDRVARVRRTDDAHPRP
jgi:hypothetical protein